MPDTLEETAWIIAYEYARGEKRTACQDAILALVQRAKEEAEAAALIDAKTKLTALEDEAKKLRAELRELDAGCSPEAASSTASEAANAAEDKAAHAAMRVYFYVLHQELAILGEHRTIHDALHPSGHVHTAVLAGEKPMFVAFRVTFTADPHRMRRMLNEAREQGPLSRDATAVEALIDQLIAKQGDGVKTD